MTSYCPLLPCGPVKTHDGTDTHTHTQTRGVCFKCSILLYIIKLSRKTTVILLHIKCSSVHLVGVRQKSCLYSSSCQSITVKCTNLTKKWSFSLYMPVSIRKEAVAAFLQHTDPTMQPKQLSKEAFTEWDGYLSSPLFYA